MSEELKVYSSGLSYVETDDLISDAVSIIEGARMAAHRAIDTALITRNWLLGKRIVNEELKDGVRREVYGRKVVPELSKELTNRYGKGYSRTALYQYAKFYRMFPEIVHSASGQSRAILSWTHYRELLRVEDPKARAWYEREAAEQMWSVKTLGRNISTQWYHRLLANHADPTSVPNVGMTESEVYAERLAYIKNPVIGEFLGLPESPDVHETQLEEAIINHLQRFLLEMGKGYAFVARQEHVRTEWSDFYIDLVFYNFMLKCFVLVDLKVGKITHQDVGQMDMYVRMYDDLKRGEGDNPTLGIVLCSETDADIARYSVLKGSEQLFAAKYRLCLPTDEQLRAEIEEQKRIFQAQQEERAALPESAGE